MKVLYVFWFIKRVTINVKKVSKTFSRHSKRTKDVFKTFITYKRRFQDIHNVQKTFSRYNVLKSPPKDQMTSVETTITTLTKILITYKKHSKDLS